MAKRAEQPRKRVIVRPGDVFRIQLPDHSFGYAVAAPTGETVFLDRRSHTPLGPAELNADGELFRLFVMNSAFRSAKWEKIGSIDIRPEWTQAHRYARRDAIHTDRYFIYDHQARQESEASPSQCQGLELWAVWSDVHIEPRLLTSLMAKTDGT